MKNLALFLFSILSFTAPAQEFFSLGLSFNPGLSWISSSSYTYESNVGTNFGLEASYQNRHFRLSSGLLYLNQTGASVIYFTDEQNNLTGEKGETHLITKSLVLPLLANYVFNPRSRFEFYAGGGLYTGIMLEEYVDHSDSPVKTGREESFWFPDFYVGLNAGLGVQTKINKELMLNLRPNFLYQLNAEEQAAYRTVSVLADLALLYRF